ncbi:amino acid permease-domain-containing protein [Chytriomyces cf. hyalinus JEL632]|nr:amino acid permease-domain-containing protein [Chytriomyces cf. hyalinus JEL632]
MSDSLTTNSSKPQPRSDSQPKQPGESMSSNTGRMGANSLHNLEQNTLSETQYHIKNMCASTSGTGLRVRLHTATPTEARETTALRDMELSLDDAGPAEGEFEGWGSLSYLYLDHVSDAERTDCVHRESNEPNNSNELSPTNNSDELENTPNPSNAPVPSRCNQSNQSSHILRGSPTGPRTEASTPKIGVWAATAIAANDIVGSVLYTIGVVTVVAGKLAPVCLLLVSVTLFFPFSQIIRQVGSRIPLNGGVYSCMFLTSTKGMAAVAACCSILDYISTATVSASSAASYFYFEFGFLNVYWSSVGLLAIFGLLAMMGARESSSVSIAILCTHMVTMLLVAIACFHQFRTSGTSILASNVQTPSISPRGWPMDLFLGYCVGMLGVTGFETSSNYIEEQADGVFPKTLRNMCFLVLGTNPIMAFLALCVLPIDTIVANSSTVISVMADVSFGKWLRIAVAIDAVVVLCGGVLTAFVGASGLLESMASDNLLPSILLSRPKFNHPHLKKLFKQALPLIPIAFFTFSFLLFAMVDGNVTTLSLIFSMSFLSVLGMFALCSLIIRVRSEREAGGDGLEPTPAGVGVGTVLGAGVVLLAIIGNAINSPTMLQTFAIFFAGLLVLVYLVLNRVHFARVLVMLLSRASPEKLPSTHTESRKHGIVERWMAWVREARNRPVAYFTNGESLHHLNHVIQYVLQNEPTSRLIIVHCFETRSSIPKSLDANCRVLDHVYPDLRLDLVLVQCKFQGGVVARIAKKLAVQKVRYFWFCCFLLLKLMKGKNVRERICALFLDPGATRSTWEILKGFESYC